MVIWQYDIPESAALVDWVVIVYNTEALNGESTAIIRQIMI